MNRAGKTRHSVFLFGYPLSHSLSPDFQNAAFEALSLSIHYVLHPFQEFDPHHVRSLLEKPSVLGANVTVPYKRAVFELVDELTPIARRVGAVNTLFWGNEDRSILVGDNTDAQGFLMDVGEAIPLTALNSAVILGAGGAARAVAVALIDQVNSLTVINRTAERAEKLVEGLQQDLSDTQSVQSFRWPEDRRDCKGELLACFRRSQLIVDTTSIGIEEKQEGSVSLSQTAPFSSKQHMELYERLPFDELGKDVLCYDLKYGLETPFLALARKRQYAARDGLGMLVRQGALSFERWTGRTAPLVEMYAAVGLP